MSSILKRIRASALQRGVVFVFLAVFVCTAVVPASFAKAPRTEETAHGGDGEGIGSVASRTPGESSGHQNSSLLAPNQVSWSVVEFVRWLTQIEMILIVRARH